MTELQLQAIVHQQGIEGTGESNLDMTVVNGVTVSKWHLDSVTYGVEVSDTLKESVQKYLQQFVGSERVFSTQNDAPRIMTEFLNKPYRFELRDEYTKGPNPLPTIKASYYHGKPATQKVLEHFCRSTPVVSSCDNPRCRTRTTSLPVPTPLRSSSRCEMLKALIECFDQAGIQDGVREISFHNYTISKDQTRPKDENLCPIRNMSTPRSVAVTELKAFLGCTQQMSQYCRYYGVIASPAVIS